MMISEFAVRRSVFAWMIMFSTIVFGAIGLNRLGVSYLPDIDFPVLSVRVTWEGAAPAIMETEIVERLEKEIINVEGITEIQSSVRQGFAQITLSFHIDRDVDVAMQELQSYLSQVRLPTDVDPPVIFKTNPEDQPIIWLGLSGDRTLAELFVYTDNSLLDRFKLLPGVGEVLIGGAGERALRVWVDNNKLRAWDLSILDVRQALASQHIESASGYLENSARETNLRLMGEGMTPEEVGNILITRRGNQQILDTLIRVRDVARVEDGLNDARRSNSISGKSGISMGIKKQRGENAIAVGQAVLAEVDRINQDLPGDMELRPLFNGVRFAKLAVDDTQLALLLSIAMTILVVYLSLGSLSSTFNIILSIPTSVMGTFFILYFSDFTLNLFTLLGLSLAIGVIVDDAIMVLENIVRHFRMGKDRVRASIDGSKEVFFAALATTVVLLSIFIPVIFLEGVIGKFFFQFGVTISAAVALSTVDALTLTPMRASRTLRRGQSQFRLIRLIDSGYTLLTEVYARLLKQALRFSPVILLIAAGFLATAFLVFRGLPSEFVPDQDQSQFGINIKLPTGSSLAKTEAEIKKIEALIQKKPDIADYIAIMGGFQGGETNLARVIVVMTPMEKREISQRDFMEKLRAELQAFGNMRISMFDFASRGLTTRGSYPVEFSIRGSNWQKLREIAETSIAEMEKTGLAVGLDMDYQEGMPEIRIFPKRSTAALSGVSIRDLSETVQTALGGAREGRFTNDGKRYDVRVRLLDEQRENPADIRRLQIRNQFGELINLTSVARLDQGKTVQTLSRLDRQRAITVTGRPARGASQAEALAAFEKIIREKLPDGYNARPGGSASGFKSAFANLYFALLLGAVVAYIVLAVQFNSFIHPISILMAVPFGIGGAILALFLFGQSLNLFSMIGLILLAGLATKNSILIVEFANQIRARGAGIQEAILEAAPLRLRPILMTSVTAMAAALPQAMELGAGSEARIPMALTVIGGIFVSMGFSLFVVPVVYNFLTKLERPARLPEGE